MLFDTIAPGEFVEVGGLIFLQNGVFEVPLQTVHGCDSLVILHLAVLTSTKDFDANPLNIKVFPNPFSQQVSVEFELPEASMVSLTLYDATGRLVKTVVAGAKIGAGRHMLSLENLEVPTGVYWLRLRSGSFSDNVSVVKI